MEISEVFDNIGDSFKKGNGTMIVGISFVVLFIIMYITQSKAKNTETVSVSGVLTSYPDVSTNADVIISSMQNSIDFATEQIQDSIEEQETYMKEGIEKTEKVSQLVGELNESMTTQFESLGTKVSAIKPTVQYVPSYSGSYSSTQKSTNELMQEQLEKQGIADFVTSAGLTLSQVNALMGTNYNGSKVTGVNTNGDGSLVLTTADGNKHTVTKKAN